MDEDAGEVILTVEVIDGVLTEDVTLTYTTADGTATSSDDYTSANGLPIPTLSALITSVTFRIPIVDDGDVDPAETFMVNLGGAPVGVSFNPTAATVTIIDNDVVIGFVPETYAVSEGAGKVTLTVEVLAGVLTQDVTLSYATMDDSAVAGDDYTMGAGTITLSPGKISERIVISILEDSAVEGAEMFTVVLSSAPAGVSFNPTGATVRIIDNDVVIGFVPETYAVSEGAGKVTLTVEVLAGVLTQDVTLSYATMDDSAVAGDDYNTMGAGTITLSPGRISETIVISILEDSAIEGAETFTVVLSSAPAGVSFNPTVATVRIIDNDAADPDPIVIGFVPETYAVSEGAGKVTLTVELRSGVLTQDVTLSYATMDDSAVTGDDYNTMGAGTITLSPGKTSETIVISILEDSAIEGAETFTIVLSGAPAGVSLNPTAATVTIIDNDAAGPDPIVIGFVPETYAVSEGAGKVTLTVELRSGVLTQDVTLSYATMDDSAVTGDDYTMGAGTITLSPGKTSETIVISILEDSAIEGAETFTVVLSSAPAGVSLNPTVATVRIIDNDAADPDPIVIGFVPETYVVSEGAGKVTLTVELRSGVLTQDVTLSYATMDDSAVTGDDYTMGAGTITLSPGKTSETIVISILEDSAIEGAETFTVVLSSAPAGVSLNPTVATVRIIDNDVADPDPIVIGFVPETYAVSEGAGKVTLTVELRSGVLTQDVTLSYATMDDSAVAGDDYNTMGAGTITLSPGKTSETIVISILEDSAIEGAETFTVVLSGAPAGVSLNPTVATVRIIDNDAAGPDPIVIGFSAPAGVSLSPVPTKWTKMLAGLRLRLRCLLVC